MCAALRQGSQKLPLHQMWGGSQTGIKQCCTMYIMCASQEGQALWHHKVQAMAATVNPSCPWLAGINPAGYKLSETIHAGVRKLQQSSSRTLNL